MQFHPGPGVGLGHDYTLYAQESGIVVFKQTKYLNQVPPAPRPVAPHQFAADPGLMFDPLTGVTLPVRTLPRTLLTCSLCCRPRAGHDCGVGGLPGSRGSAVEAWQPKVEAKGDLPAPCTGSSEVGLILGWSNVSKPSQGCAELRLVKALAGKSQ